MIDVSEYQGLVDWQKVHASGVTHAYIKFGERDREDSYALRNITHARKAGVSIGLYYFAHPSESAITEARWFLRNAGGYMLEGDLPPALDLELAEGHDYSFLNDWKAQWFAAVDAHVDCRAVFYSYFYFWKRMELYPDRPVWGAALGRSFAAPNSWAMHQYSFIAACPGVSGHVDASKVLWEPKRVGSGL